ncbi:ecdysteroid-regulated 16 kDa protein-like [Daktulosphaira vitifoliae]|uniref:ecdysteroid-regulated 16 kDa protein-like n=1 Tax=Daktulosphaira vitifoliae TaxID=58002 RepID=UPI0021A9E153|nr:ecdysteroid-regulated 16 kDa protein-like [Daktulosphaira vitifoliae]
MKGNIFISFCSLVIFLIAIECLATSTVYKCDTNNTELLEGVTIENCTTSRCPLKRNSTIKIEIKFITDFDVKDVITEVYGLLFNIPIPLLGVDSKSVCNNIFLENGVKTTCPLAKGNTYVYKDVINILEVYPKIKIDVHWGLKDPVSRRVIICLEYPAKIID